MPNQSRITNDEPWSRLSGLSVIRPSSLIRHSSFVIRHSA